MKFIDDLSLAEAVNLKETLLPNQTPTHPLNYHDHTHHVLPTGRLQLQNALQHLEEYSEKHHMKINTDKTKVMIF